MSAERLTASKRPETSTSLHLRRRRRRIAVLIWLAVAVALGLLLSSPVWTDLWRVYRLKSKAGKLRVGQSRDRVRDILGEPDAVFAKGTGLLDGMTLLGSRVGPSPERWAYGRRFDWKNAFQKKFPYFLPIRFRFFGPDDQDVVIEFDDRGMVSAIEIPKTPKP